MNSYWMSTMDIPESIVPLSASKEVRDSSSGVTPCIVMKNDGVLYHQVLSFSPDKCLYSVGEYVEKRYHIQRCKERTKSVTEYSKVT